MAAGVVAQRSQQRQAAAHGPKRVPVRDMQLDAAASLAPELLKGRLEPGRAKPDAWKVFLFQLPHQPARVDPRRPAQLKGPGRAAALGKVGPFEQTLTRV